MSNFDPTEYDSTDEHIDDQYEDYFLDILLEESSECNPNEEHKDMWNDLSEINDNDLPWDNEDISW